MRANSPGRREPRISCPLEPTPTPQVEENTSPAPTAEDQEAGSVVENQPTTTPQATPAAQTSGEPCEDKAAFYGDVTVPDGTAFQQGEKFVKTWKIRNEGSLYLGPRLFAGLLRRRYHGRAACKPNPGGRAGRDRRDLARADHPFTAVGRTRAIGSSRTRMENGSAPDLAASFPFGSRSWPATSNPERHLPALEVWGRARAQPAAPRRTPFTKSEVIALVNDARAAQGLKPLSPQAQLSAAAAVHSQDMACNDFVDHVGSDGEKWYGRVAAQGYANSASARENIYVGNPAFGGDPQGAFDWWMNSKVHRENILNPNISEIGVAYFYNSESTYGGYYTMVLARP